MNIEDVRRESTPRLLSIPGVVGVGSPGKTIKVYVESLNPVEAELPASIDGIPVEAMKVGKIYALSLLEFSTYSINWQYPQGGIYPKAAVDAQRVSRLRPVIGGVSIGHPEITAGTMGTSLDFLGVNYGMSNNHVLANASTRQVPRASNGDPILQPGPYDGGTLADKVGTLKKYIPMDRNAMNRVDVAVYAPTEKLSNEMYDTQPLTGITQPTVGKIMVKSGRTSGLTQAAILDIDATIAVSYDEFEAQFEHQVVTDYMSSGGDSGSAGQIDGKFAGLLFAGSEVVTVFNRPDLVMSALNLSSSIGGGTTPSNPLPLLAIGLMTYIALA